MFEPSHWDERYSTAEPVWSGNPNPQLVNARTKIYQQFKAA